MGLGSVGAHWNTGLERLFASLGVKQRDSPAPSQRPGKNQTGQRKESPEYYKRGEGWEGREAENRGKVREERSATPVISICEDLHKSQSYVPSSAPSVLGALKRQQPVEDASRISGYVGAGVPLLSMDHLAAVTDVYTREATPIIPNNFKVSLSLFLSNP